MLHYMTKRTLQIWLNWVSWDAEVILGGSDVITKVLERERGQRKTREKRVLKMLCHWLWWWRKKLWPKNARTIALEAEKARKQISPCSWMNQHCQHLDFNPIKLILDFLSSELYNNILLLFWASKFVLMLQQQQETNKTGDPPMPVTSGKNTRQGLLDLHESFHSWNSKKVEGL